MKKYPEKPRDTHLLAQFYKRNVLSRFLSRARSGESSTPTSRVAPLPLPVCEADVSCVNSEIRDIMTLSQLSQPGLGQRGEDNFLPKYLRIWKEMRHVRASRI